VVEADLLCWLAEGAGINEEEAERVLGGCSSLDRERGRQPAQQEANERSPEKRAAFFALE